MNNADVRTAHLRYDGIDPCVIGRCGWPEVRQCEGAEERPNQQGLASVMRPVKRREEAGGTVYDDVGATI